MLYFKVYKSQLAVIEQTLETATLMLGSESGYCLEMICGVPWQEQIPRMGPQTQSCTRWNG